jgi:hypothetical protein
VTRITAARAAFILPVFALALAASFVATGRAAPHTIEDCESITAADAYNKCLASFGPVAREHHLQPAPPEEGRGSYRGRAYRQQASPYVSGHGRQRMEFTVSPRRHRH